MKRISVADLGGLRRGDVVISINKKTVHDLPQFVSLYQELAKVEEKVLLKVLRGGATRLVVLSADKFGGDTLEG